MGHAEDAATPRKAVVLTPISFSEHSVEAAKVGVSIAQQTGGQLVFCHALFPEANPLSAGESTLG